MSILVEWSATSSGPLTRGWIPSGLKHSDFEGSFDNGQAGSEYIAKYLGTMESLGAYGLTLFEYPVVTASSGIRNITTGAMQSRFTIMEEVAITDGSDSFSKTLLARLLNARYAGLDSQETQEGVAYIVQYLDVLGALALGVTPSDRLDKLLEDGTPIEEFLGTLQQG
jgi:hypothetical protein